MNKTLEERINWITDFMSEVMDKEVTEENHQLLSNLDKVLEYLLKEQSK